MDPLSGLETPRTLRAVRYASAKRSAMTPGDLVGHKILLVHTVNNRLHSNGKFLPTELGGYTNATQR